MNALENMGNKPNKEQISKGNLDGEDCIVRSLEFIQTNLTERYRIYYSRKTKLPVGYELQALAPNAPEQRFEFRYANIKVNPVLSEASFAYQPPKDYIEINDVKTISKLKPGSSIPAFEYSILNSEQVTINGLLAANKALLLLFWAHG